MKIIATLKGAIKKYVGLEVLVTEIDSEKCPIDPQVCRIAENDCIGFTVTNRRKEMMEIFKDGQNVAYISVWAKMDIQEENLRPWNWIELIHIISTLIYMFYRFYSYISKHQTWRLHLNSSPCYVQINIQIFCENSYLMYGYLIFLNLILY